jgi:hypothetical protein
MQRIESPWNGTTAMLFAKEFIFRVATHRQGCKLSPVDGCFLVFITSPHLK